MIIFRQHHRVLVQGITGKQGMFWTEKMIGSGTKVVAGVNPKRAGETHAGVPVFASATEAMAKAPYDVAVMFIPPLLAKEAALDAIGADVKLLVCLTEHIPTQDVMAMLLAA
ncbi:MAG: succinyl-CoA synthetase subunit alpha, partial [Proteobacteria bacterium]